MVKTMHHMAFQMLAMSCPEYSEYGLSKIRRQYPPKMMLNIMAIKTVIIEDSVNMLRTANISVLLQLFILQIR